MGRMGRIVAQGTSWHGPFCKKRAHTSERRLNQKKATKAGGPLTKYEKGVMRAMWLWRHNRNIAPGGYYYY